ncbi:2-hydroxyacid dehydrogenase [Tenacibaculum ovolyticum]|uniref:2-hydroxyacid dehydrogenase n=1 Tax=Tenacibaculum ovolyticum TaxID=104270 RepID=UPI001F33C8B5|nr:glyoxylate/hydroxypyruvate reductase A [Tenacibaculum ovolyticum]
MSILLVFESKNVTPWVKALKKALPSTTIEVYPEIKDKNTVDFVICWKPTKNVLTEFPNIKIIQSAGASIDHITNSQIISKNTIITRIIDERLSNDMWEFLITVVLSELKNMSLYSTQKTTKNWKQNSYRSINNTTIAILGLGEIGGYVAKKFTEIGFNVKGWSNSKKEIPNVKSYHEKDKFDAFLNNADFLINLLPLTASTKNILNKNTFNKLPKGSFLINVARGEHLVDNDLINALDTSMLSGAFLDVFITEPLPVEHPFWKHSKIKITPHIASLTNVNTAINQITENYKSFLNKEEIKNSVSLKKGY